MELLSRERIDYIYRNRLKIIQSKERLAFSIDSVLLARFVSVKRTRGRMLDLCSGNGVVPLVLTMRSEVPITAVEIQADVADMAKRSVQMNGLTEQIDVRVFDLKTIKDEMPHGTFDVVTCNPPYYQDSLKNDAKPFTIARHEEACTIYDVAQAAAYALKHKGKAAFVFRPERIHELFQACATAGLEPKRLQYIHPKQEAQANIVLLEAVKGGKHGVTTLPPVFVYENGEHTTSFTRAYEGESFAYERIQCKVKRRSHFVYMLECKDGSYYTGYARDVWARLKMHIEGKGAKYTRGRGPFTLIHQEAFDTKREALQEEWRLKQLTKREKRAYILERRRGVYAPGHIIPRSYTDR